MLPREEVRGNCVGGTYVNINLFVMPVAIVIYHVPSALLTFLSTALLCLKVLSLEDMGPVTTPRGTRAAGEGINDAASALTHGSQVGQLVYSSRVSFHALPCRFR